MQSSSFKKNAFDISPEIQSLAEMEELGELRTVYPVSRQKTTICLTGKLCTILSVFPAVFALFFVHDTVPDRLSYAIVACILLIVGLYLTLSRRIYARWQVSLWQNGFIYEKKQLRQVFRWNQIESVQANIAPVRGGPIPYTVCRQDGYEVKLAVFSAIPEFIDVVLEESTRHLAPQELRVAAPKNTRIFTTFKVDRQGVHNGQEMLPWQTIQEFVTKNGTVTLHKKRE
jgi:hypothetical protein